MYVWLWLWCLLIFKLKGKKFWKLRNGWLREVLWSVFLTHAEIPERSLSKFLVSRNQFNLKTSTIYHIVIYYYYIMYTRRFQRSIIYIHLCIKYTFIQISPITVRERASQLVPRWSSCGSKIFFLDQTWHRVNLTPTLAIGLCEDHRP